MIVFLDTEFTDLLNPQLLSLGLVTLDGREHYVELNLTTDVGQVRRKASSDFVREEVLDMWGRIPGSSATEWEMGRRTGEWLLQLHEKSGTRVEVAFDYAADFEMMARAIRESGLWDRVREIVIPVDVGPLTGSPEGEIAAEECFRELSRRGLRRHHALADAGALRAAYISVKAVSLQMASKDRPSRSEKRLEAVAANGTNIANRAKKRVSIKQMSFPSAEWCWAVDELVDGIHELISPTGELNLHTSSLSLAAIRAMAESIRKLEADNEGEG